MSSGSCHDMVLALDHAARIGTRCDMIEANVAREGAEERNPLANEHGQTTDDHTVDESGAEKFLNGDSAVHVKAHSTQRSKFGNNLCRRACHLLNDAAARLRH